VAEIPSFNLFDELPHVQPFVTNNNQAIFSILAKQVLWVFRPDLFNSCQTGLILAKQVLWVFRPDLFNSCQTGLMGILDVTNVAKGKCKGNSFKHSIEWHLKEIKKTKKLDHFLFSFIY
jgi:hypothetical protein